MWRWRCRYFGEIHFQSDSVRHQGSSASYPSFLDYVTLNHSCNHTGIPHTPDHCKDDVQLRTIKEYSDYYLANLAGSREEGDMQGDGKEFYSICEPPIFPIHKLENIVPASLYIMLGITQNMYNLLLQVCQ